MTEEVLLKKFRKYGKVQFAKVVLNKETNTAWARPVDLIFAPDGSMLVSDDLAGTVFRIVYQAD